MPAGDCPGCRQTFDQLDALMRFGVALEQAVTGCDERAATLHVLAAAMSWWMDRSMAQFPNRELKLQAVVQAFTCALGEHGVGITIGGEPHG